MLHSSECVFLSESELSVEWQAVKYGAYTSRRRILIFQESLDGQSGHLEGIPFIFRQVPQLQCELRDDVLYEPEFLCQK
jgi:hypothetical protein